MDRQRLIRILRTGTSRGFSVVGTFLLTLVAARALDPRQLGIFFAAFTILTTIATVAQFGMDTGITWVIGHLAPKGDRAVIRKWLVFNCGIACFLSVLLFVIFGLLRHVVANTFALPELAAVLPIMLLAILPFSVGIIVGGALRGLGDSEFAGLQSGGTCFLAAIGTGLLSLHNPAMTVSDVAICYLVSSIFMCLFLIVTFIIITGQKMAGGAGSPQTPLPNLRDYLQRCVHIWLSQIFATMITFWPTLLIASMVSAEALGGFKVSERIVALVGVILLVLNDVFAPRFSHFYRTSLRANLATEIEQSSRLIFILTAMPILVIALFSRQIIAIFQPAFTQIHFIIPIMMLGQIANILTGPSWILLAMTDDQKSISKGQLISLVTAMLGYPLLIHWSGLWGAAAAWAFVVALQNVYFGVAVYRHLGISPVPFWRNAIPPS